MTVPRLSLRLDLPNGQRFGPGKAALLQALIDHATVKRAAQALEMSYPRALKLIDQMNASFVQPLVETSHGGADRGGAQVTEKGREVLRLYQGICAASAQATGPLVKTLTDLSSK